MDAVQIIKAVLESRGWDVDVVTQSDVGNELVPVQSKKGMLKCVDGRGSDADGEGAMAGPKMLGGVYAIASMRNVTDAAGLAGIVNEVREKGYIPSVHGDEHASPECMGCGYFKLWSQGKLAGLKTPDFTSEDGRKAVTDAGGAYEKLRGDHAESHVVINLVGGCTVEPDHDNQKFIADGWAAVEFGLDVAAYVTLAASTVEQLSETCRSARVIVPDAS
ncbi:MAG: cadmium-containing carbonic anhydrase [Planctomycetota bacterium]